MSKYHLGDKFIVEVKEVLESNNGTLYRSNFSTLVFDDYGLDKLQKYDEIGHKLELIDELKQAEYNRGLADAWELVRKIKTMGCLEFEKLFGCACLSDVLCNFTAEEALAKIEAYEMEKEIKVGDVVECPSENHEGIVTCLLEKEVYIIWSDGSCGQRRKDDLKKTGRTAEGLAELLRKIGE